MILGLLRVMLISMLLIYCIVNLVHEDNVYELQGNVPADNDSNRINASQGCYLELYNIIVKFDWRGWLAIIPILTHPVKEN